MAGQPKAFQPNAFDFNAFQTGVPIPVSIVITPVPDFRFGFRKRTSISAAPGSSLEFLVKLRQAFGTAGDVFDFKHLTRDHLDLVKGCDYIFKIFNRSNEQLTPGESKEFSHRSRVSSLSSGKVFPFKQIKRNEN